MFCVCPQNNCPVARHCPRQEKVGAWVEMANWWHGKRCEKLNQRTGSCRHGGPRDPPKQGLVRVDDTAQCCSPSNFRVRNLFPPGLLSNWSFCSRSLTVPLSFLSGRCCETATEIRLRWGKANGCTNRSEVDLWTLLKSIKSTRGTWPVEPVRLRSWSSPTR